MTNAARVLSELLSPSQDPVTPSLAMARAVTLARRIEPDSEPEAWLFSEEDIARGLEEALLRIEPADESPARREAFLRILEVYGRARVSLAFIGRSDITGLLKDAQDVVSESREKLLELAGFAPGS